MRIKPVLLTCALLSVPASAVAQRPPLDQADRAIANGTFAEARSILQSWRRENPRPEQEQQARYHLLSARMIMDADSAEDAYLTVAVNFPTTGAAPEALLRLAQARYARTDSTQALEYLNRLLADYPETDHRPMAAVWLARVQPNARGSNSSVCRTLREVKAGTNPETITLLRAEQLRVCGSATATASPLVTATRRAAEAADTPTSTPTPEPRTTTPPARTPARAPAAATPSPTATTSTATSKVAIQVGAFREVGGAREVKARVERAGFTDVRLVRVPGNTLIRVRVGRYANRAAAAAALARLASADISAVLVTDADAETAVKN